MCHGEIFVAIFEKHLTFFACFSLAADSLTQSSCVSPVELTEGGGGGGGAKSYNGGKAWSSINQSLLLLAVRVQLLVSAEGEAQRRLRRGRN